jgi:hypothetical protein
MNSASLRPVYSLILFALFAPECSAQFDYDFVPESVVRLLDHSEEFRPVSSIDQLPAPILLLCVDHQGRLASPGGKWEAGDAIFDETLPQARLNWAVTNGEAYVVQYEKGGIVHMSKVLVAKKRQADQRLDLIWQDNGDWKDFASFLDSVKPGAVAAPPQWHGAAKLTSAQRAALRMKDQFRPIKSVRRLPKTIIGLCADENGRFADVGRTWNVGCVIDDESVPRKRMIWAVTNGQYFVVHYEGGGFGHSYHVVVAKLPKGSHQPTEVWHGAAYPLANYREFLNELDGTKIDDSLDYAH